MIRYYRDISILAILLFAFGKRVSAQQLGISNNFMANSYYYNAAVVGSKLSLDANISYRNQWTGFEGAPSTIIGGLTGSYKNLGKIGYGVMMISERMGLMSNTGVYLNYAHHFKLTEKLKLGIGIQPGYVQYRVRLYDAILADEGDEVLTGNILSENALDLNAGIHLYRNDFYVMIGGQSLLGRIIQFTGFNENLSKHYSFIAGYKHELKKKSKIMLEPILMVRSNQPVKENVSLMLKTTYEKKYYLGASYRSDNAAGIILGASIKEKFELFYGFDFALSGIKPYQSGSHEIGLKFVLYNKQPSVEDEDEELNKSILDEMKEELKKDGNEE